jgi:hypothetical protein
MWLNVTGTPTGDDLVALATALFEAWDAGPLVYQSGLCHLVECRVQYWNGSSYDAASYFNDEAGSQETTLSPASAAAVLSWQISSSYRGGKPRNYVPFIALAQIATERVFSDAFVGAMTVAQAGLLTAISAITTTNISAVVPGTVHFFRAGVALAPPTFDPYLSGDCQKRICSQRRRLGREIF